MDRDRDSLPAEKHARTEPAPRAHPLGPVVPQRTDVDEDGLPKPAGDSLLERQARGIHTDD